MKADYHWRFINSEVNEFQKGAFQLSYPLKYPIVNSMKLNQNIFEHISQIH